MAKKQDFLDMSETGNWNVADPYTKLKIMQPLIFIDEYERIAIFGTSDIVEEFTITPALMLHARIKALKRMNHELIILCDNTLFALKKKEDQEKMQSFQESLKKIWKLLPSVSSIKRNSIDKSRDNQLAIDEIKFDKILELLSKIKSEINFLLNRSDLIFSSTEEFDPKKLKDKIMDEILESG